MHDQVIAACRRLASAGLVLGTAGNVSVRDGDRVLITPTGARFDAVTELSVVALDGTLLEGPKPTSELDLHLGVHRSGTATAVVHTHAPRATAVGLVADELPVVHYQQLLLGGAVPVAAYATFGTPELAALVLEALAGKQAALMANHGAVTTGGSLDAAVENALLLEWACGLWLDASAVGTPRTLDPHQQQAVVEAVMTRGYGQ